ncbi:hypothetical protein [Pseudomonas sp. Irchel 3F3]|uniref:hypothetical protein n=1 Tax=Pseudomonas sp. Irchel 3F3 TaxID=2009000 RepID=UPI00117B4A6F|nr:hypothetical protein [Pseudomonas sp. Irchel 3F3]
MSSVLSWIETHQGLAAWLALLAPPVFWLVLRIYRFSSNAISNREKTRNIADAVEKTYSKLLDIAASADSAGRKDRFGLATLAHEQWEIIRSLEAPLENSKLKIHLSNAAEGVLTFQRAVIDWHGADSDDDRQRNAGFTALEKVRLAAESLRKLV